MKPHFRRRHVLGLLLTSPGFGLRAEENANWEESAAFQDFFNLDYDAALAALEKEAAAHPQDPGAHNHIAYALLYRTLLRADALEGAVALNTAAFLRKPKVPMDAQDYRRFDETLTRAKNLSWDRLKRNASDAYALYCLGVAELHRGNYQFLINKEWRPALKFAGEARRLHTEAYEKNPRLVDALLVPSVHEYVVGSLPAVVRALGFLMGFRGDKKKGLEGARKVAEGGNRARVEARVLTALMERREGNPQASLRYLQPLVEQFAGNHLYRMELVNVLTDLQRYREAEQALHELSQPRYRFLKSEKLSAFQEQWQKRKRA
jgi:hypothetical protein